MRRVQGCLFGLYDLLGNFVRRKVLFHIQRLIQVHVLIELAAFLLDECRLEAGSQLRQIVRRLGGFAEVLPFEAIFFFDELLRVVLSEVSVFGISEVRPQESNGLKMAVSGHFGS